MKAFVKKEDKIGKLIRNFPQTIAVFNDFELFCVGCPASENETIEEGVKAHGKTEEELNELVEKINELLKKEL
jgi:hybrid cluster-associated redox disulfide protein